MEGAIYAGLETLTGDYLGREFRRDDGACLRIERCLIDANWGQSTDVVYQFCRQSAHAAVVMPSHGRFIGASSRPLNDYQRKPGDRCGLNWRIPNVQGRRAVRYVIYDTNFWKSFVYARLAVAMGDRGCLSLFGDRPEQHRLFAEHVTAEYRVKTEGRGRTVDEWKLRVSAGDNHWLDCLVGCAVAASIQGVALPGMAAEPGKDRQRVSFAELQRRRRGRRTSRLKPQAPRSKPPNRSVASPAPDAGAATFAPRTRSPCRAAASAAARCAATAAAAW